MKLLELIAIIFFNLLDKHIHQKKILKYLKEKKIPIEIWLDVGSHKGTYTDMILKNFNLQKAFLFEPQKEIFNYIKKKYKQKKYIYNYNVAVSNVTKDQKIFINKHDLTSSLTKANEKNLYLKIKAKLFGGNIKDMITDEYMVKTIKLSNFLRIKKIKSIDLLKIDTEGNELKVLKGLGKKIIIIKAILIEFHNNKIYKNYNSKLIHKYLLKNNFILKKKFHFPFTEWEDRIYLKN